MVTQTALLHVVITLCPHDRFVEASYKEFRQHTLEEAAMAAARHASVSKLMLLCERHPRRLIPGMLTLLACLPETVAADFYSHLLTLVSCLLMSAFCLVGVTVRATCSLSHRRVGAFDAVSMPRSPQLLQSLFAGLATPRLLKVYGAIHCQLAAAAESKERRAYHGTIP